MMIKTLLLNIKKSSKALKKIKYQTKNTQLYIYTFK